MNKPLKKESFEKLICAVYDLRLVRRNNMHTLMFTEEQQERLSTTLGQLDALTKELEEAGIEKEFFQGVVE